MSDTALATDPTEPPANKPKRKYVRRTLKPKRGSGGPPVPKASPYAGITEADCPSGCTLDRCVITHMNVCAHPFKGGLQPMLTLDPDRVRRFNEAKRILAGRKLDLTNQ